MVRRRPSRVADAELRYERAKAARRDLDHADAVSEVMRLRNGFDRLWGRSMSSPVDLHDVLRTLTAKKIPFVLTGAHGLAGWTGRPRATQDVDILVRGGRNHARAVRAIRALYPDLEVRSLPGVTAFFLPGGDASVVDVVYPHRADLEETLASAVWVEDRKSALRYRVPSLEAALANKYGAMLTPSRDLGKRQMDVADFVWMVKHSEDPGRQAIDEAKLAALGRCVWAGGGEELLKLVARVRTGKGINPDALGG